MNQTIPHTPFSTSLSGSAREAELRLRNIFSGPKKRPPALFLALVFSLCLLCGDLFSLQPAQAASEHSSISILRGVVRALDLRLFQKTQSNPLTSDLERYYEADSLPLFQIVFSQLSGAEQGAWLDKLYHEEDFLYFSAAVDRLDEANPLLERFAEQAYRDEAIAWFSALANHMDGGTLERWLDRALEDGRWNFQSMLFDRLDRDKEKDALEEELAKHQMAEYQSVGVTHDGKNYYYQGQLVNIFLDQRPNKSFYTLDLNPSGTVNVKILRSEDGAITGAAYMTDAEAKELLEDMRSD